ncbi:MAG: glycoside hydrolase family 2 TIM barrel-domain containing protein [Calditrichia bacterium]
MASTNIKSRGFITGFRRLALMVFLLLAVPAAAEAEVAVKSDDAGARLQVNSKDFMILGMNWDYFPIGTTYTYSLWTQSDQFIKTALDREMTLLKNMGVNTIRVYTGITPRWVQYIYENFGIYTVLNHSFGRYGVTVNGTFIQHTDYSDPETRKVLIAEVEGMVEEFHNTPGLLMWLLGNENNYGLFWGGAATEDIPLGETLESVRAHHMYSCFNEAIQMIKKRDNSHPVAICNGDILFLDIIAEEINDLDVFGTNMYRGISFGDVFQKVEEKLGIPVMFTEFGADAFNAKKMREDQVMQARYLIGNWKEIYEESAGKGLVGNSIGGFTFQFSDGWWKTGQEVDLDVHNIAASWSNGGYQEDYTVGENNMNEEWFGICAKGPTDQYGFYELYPRAAYYALQKAYTLDPYGSGTDLAAIRSHFEEILPMSSMLKARGDQAALLAEVGRRVRVSGMWADFETIHTGGTRVSTPDDPVPGSDETPAFRGFDHLESFYAQITAQPYENITGSLTLNYLGHVPENPINEIFYENRGRTETVVQTNGEPLQLTDLERLKVYRASFLWEHNWFKLDGFYRTGHYHWGYEGDFFGLYPEANYGPNIDIYNGNAPLGMEIAGKKAFDGLKVAYGPELWWGANPAVLVKYRRNAGPLQVTGIYQEDLDEQGTTVSSFAIPLPPTRKATLVASAAYGPFGIVAGGIWSGDTKVGETFQIIDGSPGNYRVLQDEIKPSDTWGGKLKLTFSKGRWNWYAQGAAMGLVADGNPNAALTYTGWRLKDSGRGNQVNALTGLAVTMGKWQFAPNFLWQKPIVDPIPSDVPAPGRPRNILDDPFAVLGNREMTAGELLITYDPTPATWMYAWDNDVRENARFATSTGFVYRHLPTTRDAAIGILADGRTIFAFPGAPPAHDLWEAYSRIVTKIRPDFGFIANLYAGTGQANGSDERLIHRYGGDFRFVLRSFKIITAAKINDWGPYDYHRDFNLTYPLQLIGDVSIIAGIPEWFDVPQTRLGLRFTWRSLNEYSPRYCPAKSFDAAGALVCDPDFPYQSNGSEWEIRTYLQLSIGK